MVEPVWRTVAFDAASGESNRITVTTAGRYDVIVRDDAHPLTAPSDCGRIDDRTVTCRGGPYDNPGFGPPLQFHDLARINLGDGDDSAAAGGAIGVSVSGGAGDDRLIGGPGDDRLAGDAGNDTLRGDGGDDMLVGGPAGDVDLVDGGDGSDTLGYDTTSAVVIDLARGVAGVGVARDRVQRVENAHGGAGDDTLIGDDAPNLLVAGPGSDRVDGRGGDDELDLHREVNDPSEELVPVQVEAPDARRDTVTCGDGRDTVAYPNLSDRLSACELIGASGGSVGAVPDRVGRRRALFRTRTFGLVIGLRLTARVGRRTVLLGKAFDRKETGRLVVPLTRAGRRFVARPGRHGARAEALSEVDTYGVARATFRLRL